MRNIDLMLKLVITAITASLALTLAGTCVAQSMTFALASLDGLKEHKVKAEAVTYKGQKALRVTEAAGLVGTNEDKLVIVTGSDLQDGVIEVELAGMPGEGAVGGARGFVGIAFRVAQDYSKFECFYLRPTNGRAEDQERRNHSAQYISYPGLPWQLSRKETPSKYETYVDLVPGEWTKVKIEIRGEKARLYVHGVEQPTLLVNDLKLGATGKGPVALWIGPGTVAHFANLKISR